MLNKLKKIGLKKLNTRISNIKELN